jgi:decaprenylphosphoryl-5-phosphoribose phosphatase
MPRHNASARTFPPMSFQHADLAVLKFARTRGHRPCVERAVVAYSRTGEHAACWLALGGAGALLSGDAGRRAAWLRGARIVCAAYAVNYAVKISVRRRRPELRDLPALAGTVSGLSFPSAHATTSFAAARAYSRVVPAGPLYAAAIAFGLSRPYLGVHYPTDVLGGAALGSVIAAVWR